MKKLSSSQIPNINDLKSLVDPGKTSFIELEDMKTVLSRLPPGERDVCHQLFHDYIFSSKSFQMPVTTFLENYAKSDKKIRPIKPKKKKVVSRKRARTPMRLTKFSMPVETPPVRTFFEAMIRNANGLSRERNFIRYDKEFVQILKDSQAKSKTNLRRSESPILSRQHTTATPKNNDSNSYYDLSMKRKSIEQSPKRSKSAMKNRDFKNSFVGTNQLIEIRQNHLKMNFKD